MSLRLLIAALAAAGAHAFVPVAPNFRVQRPASRGAVAVTMLTDARLARRAGGGSATKRARRVGLWAATETRRGRGRELGTGRAAGYSRTAGAAADAARSNIT